MNNQHSDKRLTHSLALISSGLTANVRHPNMDPVRCSSLLPMRSPTRLSLFRTLIRRSVTGNNQERTERDTQSEIYPKLPPSWLFSNINLMLTFEWLVFWSNISCGYEFLFLKMGFWVSEPYFCGWAFVFVCSGRPQCRVHAQAEVSAAAGVQPPGGVRGRVVHVGALVPRRQPGWVTRTTFRLFRDQCGIPQRVTVSVLHHR